MLCDLSEGHDSGLKVTDQRFSDLGFHGAVSTGQASLIPPVSLHPCPLSYPTLTGAHNGTHSFPEAIIMNCVFTVHSEFCKVHLMFTITVGVGGGGVVTR